MFRLVAALLFALNLQATTVQGYCRSDGRCVSSYERKSERCNSCARDARGRILRSPRARAAFKREYSCPSTGRASGACPGWIIDHKIPLACGGLDAPANMQWESVADAKAKDRVERAGCRAE
jgi:hypothetical protein